MIDPTDPVNTKRWVGVARQCIHCNATFPLRDFYHRPESCPDCGVDTIRVIERVLESDGQSVRVVDP